MVANRNGFFYVLDRATGAFIHAKPFVNQTWAKEIDVSGRPVELPNQRPTAEGTLTCPDLFGGTNFMSPSYDPSLGLFFVTARETCQVYFAEAPPEGYKAGDRVMGGRVTRAPHTPTGALRAIDPLTGERKWEIKHPAPSWAGVLSTAGGVVFTGTNEGEVLAADSRSGKEVWRHALGAPVYAAPITFMLDGRQFVLMPAGMTLTAFALPRQTTR
jgi:alcohol dehydrogenase (cytochrome c)